MKISLIIPCYNEEANIQKGVLDKIGNFSKNNPDISEVIISDDGSNDSSKKLIKSEYLNQFAKFKLLENSHRGKAFAILSGISQAKSDFIMFSDIDLATPIEETGKLTGELPNFDIVIGSRNSSRQGAPILRKIMAVGFMIIRDLLIGLEGIKDTQCGFKIFKRSAALEIISKLQVFRKKNKVRGSSVSAGFDLEFLFVAKKLGYKIKEIPVTWLHVETKNVNFFTDSLETLKDILKIKYFDLLKKY